jgi:hypothetical protein
VVDLPGIVSVRAADGVSRTSLARTISESAETLTTCPTGRPAPVVVPKPGAKLVARVLGVEGNAVRLELVDDNQRTVIVPFAAIDRVKVLADEPPPASIESDEDAGFADAWRQAGTTVQIWVAPVVDMPCVVTMRARRGSPEISPAGELVAQSPETVTTCPPGCTTPVIVPKPNVQLTGVVRGIDSGIVSLELPRRRALAVERHRHRRGRPGPR